MDKGTLKEDKLVADMLPDPAHRPDQVGISGYLGRSTRAGHWRLYLNAQLSEYVEVAEEDILDRKALPEENSPLGGSVLFLKSDAKSGRSKFVAISPFGCAKRDKCAGHVDEGKMMLGLDLPANA